MSKPKGVIAAGHKVTAEAASEVLREGGNAFDAVIAAMITATVPEFVFSSIGGGGFLMAKPAGSRNAVCYDFFAHTPRTKRPDDELDFYAITADFGPASQEFHIGAGSTATPSFIQGLYAIHDDLGTVPMARLFEPAILAAREGVTVTELHAYLYSIVAPILAASPLGRAVLRSGGNIAGRRIALPERGARGHAGLHCARGSAPLHRRRSGAGHSRAIARARRSSHARRPAALRCRAPHAAALALPEPRRAAQPGPGGERRAYRLRSRLAGARTFGSRGAGPGAARARDGRDQRRANSTRHRAGHDRE